MFVFVFQISKTDKVLSCRAIFPEEEMVRQYGQVLTDTITGLSGVKFVVVCSEGLSSKSAESGYLPGISFFVVSSESKEREVFALGHDNGIECELKSININKSGNQEPFLQLLKQAVKVCFKMLA